MNIVYNLLNIIIIRKKVEIKGGSEMKKVAFITSGILPVPPVRCGAIKTLIDQILTQNELHKRMDITVFSTHDDNAVIASHKYKHTKVTFIKNNLGMDKELPYYVVRHASYSRSN
jgi:hypothetical protein